jgi:hypothetical protein
MRQSDAHFISILNQIRLGCLENTDVQEFLKQAACRYPNSDVNYVKLFGTNAERQKANEEYLVI